MRCKKSKGGKENIGKEREWEMKECIGISAEDESETDRWCSLRDMGTLGCWSVGRPE
jgi:hypothetical protein